MTGRAGSAPVPNDAPPATVLFVNAGQIVTQVIAVGATIVGQALALGQLVLLPYAAAFGVTVYGFVRGYEEPTLRRQFGDRYEQYLRSVPGWRPRRRPWQGSP